MTRPATLAAVAALALSAMAATPAGAFVLAPPMPIADRGQEECAAGLVLPVSRRRVAKQDECVAGRPAVPAMRERSVNQEACEAAAPALPAGVELFARNHRVEYDGCAGAGPLVPVGYRRYR